MSVLDFTDMDNPELELNECIAKMRVKFIDPLIGKYFIIKQADGKYNKYGVITNGYFYTNNTKKHPYSMCIEYDDFTNKKKSININLKKSNLKQIEVFDDIDEMNLFLECNDG